MKLARLMMLAIVIASLAAALPLHGEEVADGARFDDHALVRIDVTSQRELRAVLGIGATPWACRVGVGQQQFSISPQQRTLLDDAGIEYQVLADDVQKLLDREQEQIQQARAQAGASWFSVFRTWPEVNSYIDDLVTLRPDLVEKLIIGTSHEGRTIYGMRITGQTGGNKPAVLFNGCQHAREWVAVMVPMYIADQMVREYDTSPQIQNLVDSAVFYIVPIVNPDGYEYTYASGGNRMWRKNRRVNGSGSYGVDLNRNWDIDWNGGHSTSTNPNSDLYVGPVPMSEPETQAMAQFILDRPEIAAHVDFHSYSQLILHPWGFTTDAPPDLAVIDSLGADMGSAIFAVHGMSYPHGTSGSLLYFASGVMPDWVYDQRGILGYTIELRPVSGNPGFLLPPEQIIPTCEENFQAALVMAEYAVMGVAFSPVDPLPETVSAGETTPLAIAVTEISSGSLDPSAAVLMSRVGSSGAFTATPMSESTPGTYSADLPAIACGQSLEYYIQVEALSGSQYTYPADAPTEVFTATAVEVVFADNFNNDLGWTVGAPDDDATAGIWERANPIGSSAGSQQVQPSSPYTGDACYITGQHIPPGGAGVNDVDNGKTTLFSPMIDLSDATDATISYWRWYSNHAGASPFNDVFVVDITNDGGLTWENVETVGPAGEQVMGGWYRHDFNVASLVEPTDQVRLRFVASDYDPQALIEAAVDAFRVERIGCTSNCPADLTGDGSIGVADLLVLLGSWGECPQPCPADLTGSGTVAVGDMLELLSAWGTCD